MKHWPVSLVPPGARGPVYLGLLAAAAIPVLAWPISNMLPFLMGSVGASLAVYLSLHPMVKPPPAWAPVMLAISCLASVLLGVDWWLSGEPGVYSAVMSLAALGWLVQLARMRGIR